MSAARVHGLSLWLLLLSIFTDALVSAGSPLQLTRGAAFSASTAEVTLAANRKSDADRRHILAPPSRSVRTEPHRPIHSSPRWCPPSPAAPTRRKHPQHRSNARPSQVTAPAQSGEILRALKNGNPSEVATWAILFPEARAREANRFSREAAVFLRRHDPRASALISH